jgi:alpha-galactosidase
MNVSGYEIRDSELEFVRRTVSTFGKIRPSLEIRDIKQGWGRMVCGAGLLGGPIKIKDRVFKWGLAGHADSEIVLRCDAPLKRIRALTGVESNKDTEKQTVRPKIIFSVCAGGKTLWKSVPLTLDSAAAELDLGLDGAREITLLAKGDIINFAHIDWAEISLETVSGEILRAGNWDMSFKPVDFIIGEETAAEFISRCGTVTKESPGGETLTVSRDLKSGLEFGLSVKTQPDFPVCEWRPYFWNEGAKPSEIIRDVKSLVSSIAPSKDGLTLLRGRGSFHQGQSLQNGFKDSFMPVTDIIDTDESVEFGTAEGGRCSDPWMPFFNVKLPSSRGFLFAIGWAGGWNASVSLTKIEAGIGNISASLMPGERISLPSIHMIYYEGDDPLRGNNILRHYIRGRIAPRYEGKPVVMPVSNGTWGGMRESEHLKRIQNIKDRKMPVDVYWIDAGWYGPEGTVSPDEFDSSWSRNTGNWKFNPTILPNGLTKISAAAHDAGLKTLLWIEPERAITGTALPTEHPEWFLGERIDGASLLLNMGNPGARDWCVEFVSDMIRKQGLDVYREDFNINPGPYWRANDAPDRQGITEIKAVESLYYFWSELRRRFPNLLIDNCSSGGRRIEIELLRHSVPLWASDMQCFPGFDPDFAQTHVAGLSLWLPMFAFGVQNEAGGDTYNFRSTMAAGVTVHYFAYERLPVSDEYPHEWLRACLEEFHACKDCFSGDYYPLLNEEITHSKKIWAASEFHRPDLGRATLFVFRRQDSDFTAAKIRLKGIVAGAVYELHDFDSGKKWNAPGEALMSDGINIEMPEPRSSRLITLRMKS